jgi:hypothetical protein
MGHFAGRFPHTISPCFFTQGAYGMAYRNSYRLPLQEGRKCLALSRPSDGKPAHLKMDITQNRLPGQRKAHFYNMQGWEGQTVSREIAKTAKKARKATRRDFRDLGAGMGIQSYFKLIPLG